MLFIYFGIAIVLTFIFFVYNLYGRSINSETNIVESLSFLFISFGVAYIIDKIHFQIYE